jgi:hypothetical protein
MYMERRKNSNVTCDCIGGVGVRNALVVQYERDVRSRSAARAS